MSMQVNYISPGNWFNYQECARPTLLNPVASSSLVIVTKVRPVQLCLQFPHPHCNMILGIIEIFLRGEIKVFSKLIARFNECVRTPVSIGDFQSSRL